MVINNNNNNDNNSDDDDVDDCRIQQNFDELKEKCLRALMAMSSSVNNNNNNNNNANTNANAAGLLLFDKSPKGSVDYPIRNLVNLINLHPDYATTSSCSGRVSLFDPGASVHSCLEEQDKKKKTKQKQQQPSSSQKETSSSSTLKGTGHWRFVKHGRIHSRELRRALDEASAAAAAVLCDECECTDLPLQLKFEPFLMHIACRSYDAASKLLHLAMATGLRESGAMFSSSSHRHRRRVTVAIRSYALAVNIPLSPLIHVSNEYLNSVVHDFNQRFKKNEKKLQKFYDGFESMLLFESGIMLDIDKQLSKKEMKASTMLRLPDLNLWGHASAVVPTIMSGEGSNDFEVYVFGGYGTGPSLIDVTTTRRPSRSASIYSIQRNNLKWSSEWKQVTAVGDIQFQAREGHKACTVLGKMIAIFGGREGPNRPNSDLYLFDTQRKIFMSVQTSGEVPTPRWAHTFTALPENDSCNLAVVIGGRCTAEVLSSMHVLSYCNSRQTPQNDTIHISWSKLSFEYPVYGHCCSVQPSCGGVKDKIFVFGGVQDDVSQVILSKQHNSPQQTGILEIEEEGRTFNWNVCNSLELSGNSHASSGSICSGSSTSQLIVVSGGVNPIKKEATKSDSFINIYQCLSENKVVQRNISFENDGDCLDIGSMVKSCSFLLPVTAGRCEIVCIGGGVESVAFGQFYSPCYSTVISGYDDFKLSKCKKVTLMSSSTMSDLNRSSAVSSNKSTTDVLYVSKRDAKTVKTALESLSFLDKRYRMSSAELCTTSDLADPAQYIAIPITQKCLDGINEGTVKEMDWYNQSVVSLGRQSVLFSTVVLGTKAAKKKKGIEQILFPH